MYGTQMSESGYCAESLLKLRSARENVRAFFVASVRSAHDCTLQNEGSSSDVVK